MLKVFYEEYHNDFVRNNRIKNFSSLSAVEEWIFGQMKQKYSDSMCMYWPTDKLPNQPSRIKFRPEWGGADYLIHQIKDENDRILFSDGTMTDGQRHWSKAVKDWCQACDQRQDHPVFDFAE